LSCLYRAKRREMRKAVSDRIAFLNYIMNHQVANKYDVIIVYYSLVNRRCVLVGGLSPLVVNNFGLQGWAASNLQDFSSFQVTLQLPSSGGVFAETLENSEHSTRPVLQVCVIFGWLPAFVGIRWKTCVFWLESVESQLLSEEAKSIKTFLIRRPKLRLNKY
jgi:hypothetical protein